MSIPGASAPCQGPCTAAVAQALSKATAGAVQYALCRGTIVAALPHASWGLSAVLPWFRQVNGMELEVQDLAGEAAVMARSHTFLGLGCSRCAAADSLILSILPVLCLPKRMPVPGPALALVWTLPHCLVCMGQGNRMLTPAPAPVGQAAATHSLMVTQLAAACRLSRWDLRDPDLATGQAPVVAYADGKDYGRSAQLSCMATAGEGPTA